MATLNTGLWPLPPVFSQQGSDIVLFGNSLQYMVFLPKTLAL
jgi:hypothetical protein